MNIRDAKTKQAFIEFLQDPKTKDLRFWQALSAFSHRFIFFGTMSPITEKITDLEDTFYIESDKQSE